MTMKRAGDTAKMGFYFNTKTWEISLHRTEGALPGADTDRYLRVPAVALLFLGPVMGFFFVVFLPFIGFALVARELGYRVAKLFGRKAGEAATVKTTPR